MLDKPYCHVILAVDFRVKNESTMMELHKRICEEAKQVREKIKEWVKKRDPNAETYCHNGYSIAPSMVIQGSDELHKMLLDESIRPKMIESIVYVDS